MKIGYARVSTDKKEQDSSVEAQVRALTEAGCTRVLKDRQSAFKPGRKRKQWEACKDLIRSGQVTHFMICSLSRGSRQQENTEMSRLCKAHGVEFKILDGTQSDVSTAEGMLMVGIMDTVNSVDSLVKGLAVRRGTAARQAAGATAVGRCPFGYRYDGTKPVPDPKTWRLARQLWDELAACEFRVNHVLRHDHPTRYPFSNSGMRRWIRNPLLMGLPKYTTVTVKPLVTEEEWLQAQEVMNRRDFAKTRAPNKLRLFSGLFKCGKCGANMHYNLSGKKWRLKCMRPSCEWYGKGLAEWKVRDQIIGSLRASVDQMAELAQRPSLPTVHQPTEEQIAAKRDLDLALGLQARGISVSDKSLAELRAKLAMPATLPGPDWGHWADLIRQEDILQLMTDAELRAVISELVVELTYIGDPNRIEIRLRHASEESLQ
nr:putative integrase [uncultured Mediterranean phage uvMED]